jgi:hypothetical protein
MFSWFNRHLNWTMILTWVILVPFSLFLANGGKLTVSFDTFTEHLFMSVIALVLIAIFVLIIMWAIKQKGRSVFHVFWILAPFGFIVLLLLKNLSMDVISME